LKSLQILNFTTNYYEPIDSITVQSFATLQMCDLDNIRS